MDDFKHPEINAGHLLLRALNPADREKIFEIRSNTGVAEYLDRPLCGSEDEALQFIDKIIAGSAEGNSFYWVISDERSGEFMGTICLWNFSGDRTAAEVGYELLPEFQGRGIMNRALKAVIDFCFNSLKLATINADVHKDNVNSINLLRRYNFKRTEPADSKEYLTYKLRRI